METDLAYAAGLIDGEGTIVIEKATHDAPWVENSKRQYLRRRKHNGTRYRTHVTITITKRAVCDWMEERFGGHIYVEGRRAANRGHSDVWIWRVTGDNASVFLGLIRPYLVLKGEQADNAIEFQKGVMTLRRKPLTDEELAVREACYLTQKALNKRGPN